MSAQGREGARAMAQNTRPPVGSTGTLAELQVQPGDGVRFMTGHEYEITRVCHGSDVDFEAKRIRLGDVGDLVTINNAREDWTLVSRATPDQPAHIINHNGRECDLTALEAPFGLLPDPVQDALKAWPHGFEFYVGEWVSLARPSWLNDKAYRAKPAPVETRVPCQRGLAAFHSDMEFGTCIKRHDGAIDWATWEDAE